MLNISECCDQARKWHANRNSGFGLPATGFLTWNIIFFGFHFHNTTYLASPVQVHNKLLACCAEIYQKKKKRTKTLETAAVGSAVWLQLIPNLSQHTQSSSTCRASGLSWPIQPFVLWQNFFGHLTQLIFDLNQLISRKKTHLLASFPSLQWGK